MKRFISLAAVLALAACGGGVNGAGPADAGPQFIAGFNPPAVPDGYTRYVTPPIDNIQPGDGTLWCQWIAAPSDADLNVVDIRGEQSKYGHHVVLYASSTNEPVGTSRPCTTDDMVSVQFLGGIGGEGTGSVTALPPGVVLRLPKGYALMANVHFLNLGTTAIQGQAVLDVKFDQPNANERVAGFFNNTDLNFHLPASTATVADRDCHVQSDMNFFMFSNHMHNYGTSAVTTVTHADGGTDTMVSDDTRQSEEQFNPNWKRWSTDLPYPVYAGDTLHTHCAWNNTSTHDVVFPEEMCVGVGFFLPPGGGDGTDIYCVDGNWSVGQP
jgi:hypothetical protein